MDDNLIERRDWVPLNKRDHLSIIHICGIAAGTLVSNLLWCILFTLFTPLSELVKLESWIRILVLFYGSLSGFIISPLLGVISDTLMFRWGRRRIFMLIGGIILVGGLLIMMYTMQIGRMILPNKKDGENGAQKGVLIASMVLCFTAGNIVQAPARTLCSDVTPPKQQVLMSNICQIYGGIGGVFSNLVGGLKLYEYTQLTQEQFILVVCLSISAVAMTVSIIVTPETPLNEKPPKINPFKQIWNALKRMPRAYRRVIIPFTLSYLCVYQFQFQFSHFMGNDIFGGSNQPDASDYKNQLYQDGVSWSMMCNVMNCGFQCIYGFVNTKFCEWIGMKAVMIIGLSFLTLAFFSFFFVNNKYAYLGITIPIGIGSLIINAIPYAIVSLVIPTEELGANLGLLNCFGVFGQQLSNFGIGSGLGAIWPDNPRMMIGLSSIPGLIGVIFAFFIITPGIGDMSEYNQIPDRSTQEVSASLISTDDF